MWLSLALLVAAAALWRRCLTTRTGAGLAAATVFLGLLLLATYQIVDMLSGSGIDASVLYQLRVGFEGAGAGDFLGVAVLAAGLFVLAVGLSVLAYHQTRAVLRPPGYAARQIAALTLLAGSFWFNPALHDIAALVRVMRGAEAAAATQGEAPEQFVPLAAADFVSPRKNFVLLYLESVERTYLDQTIFPGLMPNLQALEAEALSFTDITEVSEASWTIAGMVASQCGMPLIGSGAGIDQFLPGATCLGDLLREQRYQLSYIGGADLDFGGKGAFYRSHGFEQVLGRDELAGGLEDPAYLSNWGLYDDSLYAELVRQFDALAAQREPFGLVGLTLDTHHPFGYMSRACGDLAYEGGGNQFLNAVHCADRMAGEFIRHVRASPGFEDTVLVVASDHMAMPNLARDRLETGARRNLVLLFGRDIAPGLNAKPGTTLDLAPTLLGAIGAPTPALGYGRDLRADAATLRLGPEPIEGVLARGRAYLAALWSYPQIADGIVLDQAENRLGLGNRHVGLPVLFRIDTSLQVTGVDFFMIGDSTPAEVIARLPDGQRYLWVDSCLQVAKLAASAPVTSADFCALASRQGAGAPVAIALADGVRLGLDDLAAHFEIPAASPASAADLRRRQLFAADEVAEYVPPSGLAGRVGIRSGGFSAGDTWVADLERDKRLGLLRGLTLIGFNTNTAPVKLGHIDTCAYGGATQDNPELEGGFQATIARNADFYGAFAIVADDSVVCYQIDPGLEPLFAGTGLSRWRELGYEQPYVALISGDGQRQEYVGKPRTAIGVEARDFIRPLAAVSQRRLPWLPRVAHGGGGLNGQTMTNAHEALEANADAFELIEIDLSWTSDRHLVCLLGWDQPFLAQGGFAAALTLAEFERRVAAGAGFRPCTLASLTDWMRAHDGVRIVLDLREDALTAYRHIAETYPDLRARFVPQAYQPEDYRVLRDLGYDDVIWSLYQYAGDNTSVLAWLGRMDLLGLTMPPERLAAGLARQARAATGVLSWVHTINTLPDLDAALRAGAAEVYTDFLLPPATAHFEVVSAGFGAGNSSLRLLPDGALLDLGRGVSLLGLSVGVEPRLLAAFDGCAMLDTGLPPDPLPYRAALQAADGAFDALAVVVHDSAFCDGIDLAPVLEVSPLRAWREIGFRAPYIGLIRADGRVLEFNGQAETALQEVLAVEPKP